MRLKKYIYVYCVMFDVGYYMEPDVELVRVFSNKKSADKFILCHKLAHGHYFIEKKRLVL